LIVRFNKTRIRNNVIGKRQSKYNEL